MMLIWPEANLIFYGGDFLLFLKKEGESNSFQWDSEGNDLWWWDVPYEMIVRWKLELERDPVKFIV